MTRAYVYCFIRPLGIVKCILYETSLMLNMYPPKIIEFRPYNISNTEYRQT